MLIRSNAKLTIGKLWLVINTPAASARLLPVLADPTSIGEGKTPIALQSVVRVDLSSVGATSTLTSNGLLDMLRLKQVGTGCFGQASSESCLLRVQIYQIFFAEALLLRGAGAGGALYGVAVATEDGHFTLKYQTLKTPQHRVEVFSFKEEILPGSWPLGAIPRCIVTRLHSCVNFIFRSTVLR